MNPPAAAPGRLRSVDALRGLTMLVLVSNPMGGFGFFEVARNLPDSPVWAWLGAQFFHAEWVGCTAWDLVMPVFVTLVGVSMPFSIAARRARGDSDATLVGHALLRSATLFVLGCLLLRPFRTALDQLWPFLLLLPGLPLERWLRERAHVSAHAARSAVHAFWIALLAVTSLRIAMRTTELGDYDLVHLLQQLGLAYPLAFVACLGSVRRQLAVAGGVLVAWWLAFALHPLPPASLSPASVGAVPGVHWFEGFYAHWNKGANFASDFDLWLLNALPRAAPYEYNAHGYQTLNFVPLVATILCGAVAGALLRGDRLVLGRVPVTLARLGLALLAAGLAAAAVATPLVKSLWTASYGLYTSGLVVLGVAALHRWLDDTRPRPLVAALAAVGANSLLLYVLALAYHWRFTLPWTAVFGPGLYDGPYGPLVQALVATAGFWVLACVLARLRLQIRL